MKRGWVAIAVLLPVALLLAFGGYRGREEDGREWLEVSVGGVAARVELAATPEARRNGLMHRQALPPDQGMLLAYPRERVLKMWMLNTFIPLDVGFFDSGGRLVNRLSMEPDGGRRIYASAAPARYALEMNRGWFDRHRIAPGARLVLPRPVEAR